MFLIIDYIFMLYLQCVILILVSLERVHPTKPLTDVPATKAHQVVIAI